MPEAGQQLQAMLDGYAELLDAKQLALPKHQRRLVRWAKQFPFDRRECRPRVMRSGHLRTTCCVGEAGETVCGLLPSTGVGCGREPRCERSTG